MALATIHLAETRPFSAPLPTHRQLESVLASVTLNSAHSYELAVRRLLEDMVEMVAHVQLDTMTYQAALATAVDVLFFFNYDPDMLAAEEPGWYRASLIHQMGHGMLQALEKFRPELASKPFFRDAVTALSIDAMLSATPVRCRQWASAN